jgi:fibronectin type 3 domain-containing protein
MLRTLVALAALLMTGCAYIGEPLPPLANVPAAITDLWAMQRGATIMARFSRPAMTTEGVLIKRPLRLDLRVGPTLNPFNPDQWAARAKAIPEPQVEKGIARYTIPATEWVGKEVIIMARVIGSNGKESAWSNLVAMPVVATPETPRDVRVAGVAGGVSVSWTGAGDRFRVLRRAPGEELFSVIATVPERQWTDPGAEYGREYHYQVQAVVQLPEGREAESLFPDPVSIVPEDRFAPATPVAFHAAGSPGSIELSWDNNSEPDLAGYRVYRAAPGAGFERLADLAAVPSYSDRTAEPGKLYRYAVTAVDKAGNESARSEPVEAGLP